MFRLYWCYAALGSASCYDVGGVDFVYMKLFCCQVLLFVCFCSCVKLVSAGPMKGRLDFFFEENVRCVYKNEWTMRLRVNECAMRL